MLNPHPEPLFNKITVTELIQIIQKMKLSGPYKSVRTSIAYSLFLFLVFSLALYSCKKDSGTTPVANSYLVKFQKDNTYSASFIKLLLGSLNNSYPGINDLSPNVTYGIDIYKLTYNTTYRGTSLKASGLVCIPSTAGTFPLISFQNGTNTLRANAPSANPSDPLYTLLECMAGHGFIVVIPDYLGFGDASTMLHPYYDKAATNQAVIDMILATQEMLNEATILAKGNGKNLLMGYSQGGWATLAALKFANDSYSDKINVSAASCGAGAYDISAMSSYVLAQQVYPGPLYLPYFIYSKITAGDITNPLSTYFREPYASRIPTLFNGSFSNDQVDAQLTDTIADLVTVDLLQNLTGGADFSSLRSAMTTNSVQAWNTSALLRFYHGTADLNVPPGQSDLIYNQFISLGLPTSQVSLISIPGATHDTGLIPWGIATVKWFDTMR